MTPNQATLSTQIEQCFVIKSRLRAAYDIEDRINPKANEGI
jgi:hypothetical protein